MSVQDTVSSSSFSSFFVCNLLLEFATGPIESFKECDLINQWQSFRVIWLRFYPVQSSQGLILFNRSILIRSSTRRNKNELRRVLLNLHL